ncbi:SIS domain-containing protein [Bacillus sp. M6-12]|uniref:SIS domain-containing protein n=1 Tax=Bacillus sp. M6-12 TaxID=2054166 RepID=UPI0015E0ACBB|nr:SIS domain-containing protein [Bacillus sp. M6-12]
MNTHTWNEITNQDEALQKTLSVMRNFVLDNSKSTDVHVFTGCGTSFYLAHSAAKYFQKVTGKTAAAVPASEIFMDENSVFSKDNTYQLIAISRSGTTSEVVKALDYVKEAGNIETLALTCNEASETAKLADKSIVLDFISEKSVVMTQSFTNMLYSLQLYAAIVAESEDVKFALGNVPELSSHMLEDKDKLKSLAGDSKYTRYVFLGASVFNGIAKEATLKLKEMTQTECESYSNLEFRHGPISIVDTSTVAVLLSSDASEVFDGSLVTDIQEKGGKVVVFAKEGSSVTGDITVSIPTKLGSDEVMAAYMPHLQLLAYFKAVSLGLNPDEPRNLTQVVKLNF